MKRTIAFLVAAASLGCTSGALKGMSYGIGADYWLAEFDGSMEPDDGAKADAGDLGIDDAADVYDIRISLSSKKRGARQLEHWTLGFWQANYADSKVPGTNLTFGDTVFTAGDKVKTKATFTAYRIAYEESAGQGGGLAAGETGSGWLGLAFFTFDIKSKQSATGLSESFRKENIPTITVGYRHEVTRGAVTAYASLDWMDLGWFKISGVTGQHLDTQAGLKYTLAGKICITAGYRYFEGEYDYSGNKTHFVFQGVTFGAEVTF